MTTLTPKERWQTAFLEQLAKTGNVSSAAKFAGIARQTAYLVRQVDDKFAEDWDDAKEQSADVLLAEARRRAAEGVIKPVYYQGEKVGENLEYSDVLLMFLLKGLRPAEYRDNVSVQHSGTVKHEHTAELSDDERIAGIDRLLEAARARKAGLSDRQENGIKPALPQLPG